MYKLVSSLFALALVAGCATSTPQNRINTISQSQQKYIKKYEKQKTVPKPEDMLLNTDPEPKLTKGFTSLYNGKNLDGWMARGGTSRFEAQGDMIVGTAVQGSPSTYFSTTKEDYSDFIFTVEMKWIEDGNSGVMFRAKRKPGTTEETVFGPQCEMEGFKDYPDCRGWSGGIYGQGVGGWMYPLWLDAHAKVRKALKKDDWNRVTIMAKGDTVKTWLNGIPAAHWKTDEYKQGFFSLQIHAGGHGKVYFRNIKVKELK